ncbi:MAG TPA: tetratricopeptide repeat protein, partial [Anaerolineae bacterium]|nr:tetratricopeptide repeat protein [Anaerolineae bacterium]
MGKSAWILLAILVVVVALTALAVYFWPVIAPWLPHPLLLKAWVHFLTVDLDIGRWGPIAVLLLVAVIELIWALNLGRRSGAVERQMNRLERLHAREIEVLNQEIALLKDERRALRSELELREGLIREEKTRLWAKFEELQRASGLSMGKLLTLDTPRPSPEVRSDWRQSISQLERIEMVSSVTARRGQSALQLQQHADELVRLGNACFYLEQYERALTHYSAAISLTPNDPEALINHAVVNHVLGRHQAALQDLGAALKLEEHPWAYLYRGLVRESLGEDKRALEDYGRALRLDPEFAEAYYRRGLLHAKAGDYEKAIEDQNQALVFAPDHAGAYTARGAARAAMGDSQWALNDLDKGCMLAPERYE